MKRMLKKIIPPIIIDIYRKCKAHNLSEIKYFSLNDLDKKLEQYLPEKNGFFVELGANNGIAQSNTLYFERAKGWKGVLVEPVLHNYFACRANRSGEIKIFCNACVSFSYKDKFVPIGYANLMSTPFIETSDLKNVDSHLESGKKWLGQYEDVVVFGAVARALNEILIEADAPRCIDLLSLDVEGGELDVLQGVDLARFSFRYICVECRDIDRLHAYLQKYGYRLVEQLSKHDYLFALT